MNRRIDLLHEPLRMLLGTIETAAGDENSRDPEDEPQGDSLSAMRALTTTLAEGGAGENDPDDGPDRARTSSGGSCFPLAYRFAERARVVSLCIEYDDSSQIHMAGGIPVLEVIAGA